MDIKNKNELKRRIDLFLHDFTHEEYRINEEYCKETMRIMVDFIRDVQTNIMLAIRLEDAMAVCAAAADASRKAEGCTETKEDAGIAEPKSGL